MSEVKVESDLKDHINGPETVIVKTEVEMEWCRDVEAELSDLKEPGPIFQQGVCRCCLSEGNYETMEIKIGMGHTQRYVDMLSEVLGVTLVRSLGPRLICGTCAAQLRQAFTFKNQVLAAENEFFTRLNQDLNCQPLACSTKKNLEPVAVVAFPIQSKEEEIKVEVEETNDTKLEETYWDDSPMNTIPLAKSHINFSKADAKKKELKKSPTQPYKEWQCILCKRLFLTEQLRNEHVRNHLVECNKCCKIFKTPALKDDHMKHCKYIQFELSPLEPLNIASTSNYEKSKIENRIFKCDICQKDHTMYELKRRHGEYEYVKYTCKQCLRVFRTPRERAKDKKRHQLVCEICNEKFESSKLRGNHIKSKHGHKCLMCSERIMPQFKHQHDVEVHGAKLFECGVCNKICRSNSLLIRHQRKAHMKERNSPCPKCDYVAFDVSSLRRHMFSHSTEKKFQCEYCLKKFIRRSTLRYHIRIHTGDKRAICKICGEAFVQRASLKYHLEKYHPGEVS